MTVRALLPHHSPAASLSRTEGSFSREMSLLGAHYERCNGSKGRWFSIECAVEALDSFVARRFVTTVCAIGAVVAVGAVLF